MHSQIITRSVTFLQLRPSSDKPSLVTKLESRSTPEWRSWYSAKSPIDIARTPRIFRRVCDSHVLCRPPRQTGAQKCSASKNLQKSLYLAT